MSEFTLDTSGFVRVNGVDVSWPALTPFKQGYVEALFASIAPVTYRHPYVRGVSGYCEKCHKIEHRPDGWRFSDLAPETLAAILRDCDRCHGLQPTRDAGGYFWELRNGKVGMLGFPPLTPYLGEDGKVYLREAT